MGFRVLGSQDTDESTFRVLGGKKDQKDIFDALTEVTIDTEGLMPGQTPIRITNDTMRGWETIQGIPVQYPEVVPEDLKNFFWTAPNQVPEVVKRQYQSYTDPGKWRQFNLTEESTVEDMIRTFDQQNPEEKIKRMKEAGYDLSQKISELNMESRYQSNIKQQQAQAMMIKLQQEQAAKEAADPRNWTYEQTKKHFKDNPAKTPGEEAQREAFLDMKKQQKDSIKDANKEKQKAQEEILTLKQQGMKMGRETLKSLGRSIEGIFGSVGAIVSWMGEVMQEPMQIPEGLEEASPEVFAMLKRREESEQEARKAIGGKLTKWGKEAYDFYRRESMRGIEAPDPETFRGTFMQNPSWTRAVALTAGAIPSLAAAGAITYWTKNPQMGGLALGFLDGSTTYMEAREAGKDVQTANQLGGLSAVGTAALEGIALGRFFRGGRGKLTKDVLAGAVNEGLEEGAQQVWQNAIAKFGYDNTRSLFDGLAESIIAGAGSGGIAGGFTSGRNAELDNLIAKAKESGLTQANIDEMTQHIANQFADNAGPIDKLIDKSVDELNKILMSERGEIGGPGEEEIPSKKEMEFPAVEGSITPEQIDATEKEILAPEEYTKLEATRAEANAMPETIEINTPERQIMRDRIIRESYGQGAKKKERRADIVLGLPAVGKNTYLAKPLLEEHGALLVDNDTYKEKLPEYNKGVGARAVHKESSDIIEEGIMEKALFKGDNIVIPRLGKNLVTMQELIKELKNWGYKVNLHYADAPVKEAIDRSITRYRETGRFVDPQFIGSLGLITSKNYDILKSEEGVESYGKWSTAVKKGEPAVFIEGSEVYQRLRSGRISESGKGLEERREEAPRVVPEVTRAKEEIGNEVELSPEEIERLDAITEGEPTEVIPKEMTSEQQAELAIEMDKIHDTPEGDLFKAIRAIGKIAPYREGFLAEEFAEIPATLKDKNAKQTLDTALEALKEYGWNFESDTDLMEAIKDRARNPIERVDVASLRKVIQQARRNRKQVARYVAAMGRILGKPMPTAQVKKQVREATGQIKIGELISEVDALQRLMEREQQISKQAESAGKRIALEKERARIKQLKENQRAREATKREVNKMIADINKLPTENLPLDYKDKIEEIKAPFDLKKRTGRTIARRNSMKAFVDRMSEAGEQIEIPQEKLDLLEKTTLNDMTVEELRDVHDTIMRLYFFGKKKNEYLTNIKNRKHDAAVGEGTKQILGSEGFKETTPFMKSLREAGFKEKSKETIKNFVASYLRIERILNMMDNWGKGIMTEMVFDPLLRSENKFLENSNRKLERIKQIHKDIDISKTVSKREKIGQFEGLTRDGAMFIYANSLNDHNREILYNSGITDLDIAEVRSALSDKERKAVETMVEDFYDKEDYEELSKMYEELTGVHLPKEQRYFPIMNLEEISAQKAIEMDIMRRYGLRRAGVEKGFTKERVSHSRGFDKFSYFDTIYRHWQNVEHYKAYAKAIRDVSKFIYDPRIKTAIRQKYGEGVFKQLDKWLKDVSWGGEKSPGSEISKISRWVRTNFATSVLGYNIVTMSKQPVSFMQGSRWVGEKWALQGLTQFLRHPMRSIEFVASKSPMMRYRSFRQERELREIIAGRGIAAKLGKGKFNLQKVKEGAMKPIMAGDKVAVTSLWLGAYNKVIKTGKVGNQEIEIADLEKAAIAHADEAIRKTQPMGGLLHLAGVFRGPEYQKLYTIFKNQLNQNFNITYELYSKFGGQAKTGSNIREFIKGNVMYILMPAFLIGLISRKRLPEDPKEMALDVAQQITGTIILLSHLYNSWGSTTPLDALIQDARMVIHGKKIPTKVKYLLRLVSKIYGIPYTQIERTILGKPFGTQRKSTKKKRQEYSFQ